MRKKANIHYIYKTTCNVTGKWYVGMHSTNNLEDGYMGSGKRLRYSIRKYGLNNHTKEILEYLPTREELILREIEIVNKELILDNLCMNLKEGGTGGFSDEEHKNKFLKAGRETLINKIKNDFSFFEKWSKMSSKRMKNTHKEGKINYNTFEGKSHSDETKQLISEIKKGTGTGETNSQYGTCWITNGIENKKIKKEDFDSYLLESWVKGRTSTKYN